MVSCERTLHHFKAASYVVVEVLSVTPLWLCPWDGWNVCTTSHLIGESDLAKCPTPPERRTNWVPRGPGMENIMCCRQCPDLSVFTPCTAFSRITQYQTLGQFAGRSEEDSATVYGGRHCLVLPYNKTFWDLAVLELAYLYLIQYFVYSVENKTLVFNKYLLIVAGNFTICNTFKKTSWCLFSKPNLPNLNVFLEYF